MENNETHKLKFDIWKEEFSPWSERDINHLINVISITRLNNHLKFNGYGTVSFEDEDKFSHYNPIVEVQDKYNKKTSNIVIFDVVNKKLPFDKMFIYQFKGGSKGTAGYYMYSSKNPEIYLHKYYLENLISSILLAMSKTFSELHTKYDS